MKNLKNILLATTFTISFALSIQAEDPSTQSQNDSIPASTNSSQQHKKSDHKEHNKRKFLNPDERFFAHFPKEVQEKLKRIQKENPERFHEEVHAFFVSERKKEQEKLLNLRKLYLKEKDPAKKKEIEQELRVFIEERLDKKIKTAEKWLQFNEDKLNKMKQQHEEFRKSIEDKKLRSKEIVEKTIGIYLNPDEEPSVSWERKKHKKNDD